MVHMMIPLKCNQGHSLPISFDSNECGCHSDGKPCVIVTCKKCLEDCLKDKDMSKKLSKITIPLGKEGMKVINKILNEQS